MQASMLVCQITQCSCVYTDGGCVRIAQPALVISISARISSTRLATRGWIPRTELAVLDSPRDHDMASGADTGGMAEASVSCIIGEPERQEDKKTRGQLLSSGCFTGLFVAHGQLHVMFYGPLLSLPPAPIIKRSSDEECCGSLNQLFAANRCHHWSCRHRRIVL